MPTFAQPTTKHQHSTAVKKQIMDLSICFYLKLLQTMSHDSETKLFILHCENAAPEHHWYLWLEQQLTSMQVKVERVFLADASHPDIEVWQTCLQAQLKGLNEHSIVVAHGLSCLALAQFLSQKLQQHTLKAAIFIASLCEPIAKHPEWDAFIQQSQFENTRLRSQIQRRVVVFSSNDLVVPAPLSFKFSNLIHAQMVEVAQAGHFRAEDGYAEFPQLLQMLQALLKVKLA